MKIWKTNGPQSLLDNIFAVIFNQETAFRSYNSSDFGPLSASSLFILR